MSGIGVGHCLPVSHQGCSVLGQGELQVWLMFRDFVYIFCYLYFIFIIFIFYFIYLFFLVI